MHKRRAGFTLIELLIVIVIIGILAAIAIPKFGKTRERAFFKSIMSDLRNLNAQEEIYYSVPSNNYTYTTNITSLDVTSSDGVTATVFSAGTQGWAATGWHSSLATTQYCGVWYGTPATTPGAVAPKPGVVACAGQ